MLITYVTGLDQIKSFYDIIKGVFRSLFENILAPILIDFMDFLWKIVADTFISIVQYWLYMWLKGLCLLIDKLANVMGIFAGTVPVQALMQTQVNGIPVDYYKSMSLLEALFQNTIINRTMYGLMAIGFILAFVFTAYKTAKSISDTALEDKNPISTVLKNAMKAAVTFLLIPLLCTIMIQLSVVLLSACENALTGVNGNNNATLGTLIFLSSSMDAARKGPNASTQPTKEVPNPPKPSIHDEIRGKYLLADNDGTAKRYYEWSDVNEDFNLGKMDFFLGFTAGIFIICVIIGCIFIFIRRIFEILILYIVSPLFAATIPLDDGATFKKWTEMFVAKVFAAFGSIFAMRIYICIAPYLSGGSIMFSESVFADTIMKCFLLMGGAIAVFKSQHLFMQILNEQEANREREGMGLFIGKVRQAVQLATTAATTVATGGAGLAATVGAKAAASTSQKFVGQAVKSAVSGIGQQTGGDK